MAQFSLLARIQQPSLSLLQRLIASLQVQTLADWELVLLVDSNAPADLAVVTPLLALDPRLRLERRPYGERVLWSAEALAPTLGNWLGVIGQHDLLVPEALASVNQVILDQPAAKVVFTDEEALGTWRQESLHFAKGGLNPGRLAFQEYLRDLAVFQTAWFRTLTCDRLASDNPAHDLYLRLLETVGPAGFAHVPAVLYQRHRNRLVPAPSIGRLQQVDYDLHAIRQHHARQGRSALVRQLAGSVETRLPYLTSPALTTIVVLGDDPVVGEARLHALKRVPEYRPMTVIALHAGTDLAADMRYRELCAGLRFRFRAVDNTLVESLNQEILLVDTDRVLLLQGELIGTAVLQRWLEYSQLPGIGAVGAHLMSPTYLTQPGTFGWAYEGEHWNSRGRFNLLSVPHNVSVLSPAALLLDRRQFIALGSFDPSYPVLYGMDYTLRLTAGGMGCLYLPGVQVQTTDVMPVTDSEKAALQAAWAGWTDPYGLHQLL